MTSAETNSAPWTFLATISLCALISALAAYKAQRNPDPLDTFEVKKVFNGPDGASHAVSYLYHRARYATDVMAIAIVREEPPQIGSSKPVGGAPVLVWSLGTQQPELSWQQLSGRLIAKFAVPTNMMSEGDFLPCFRGEASVCFDRNWVDVFDVQPKAVRPESVDTLAEHIP
jgi:hypothetical protein